jgi:methylthioribose-1-phosphate isomerase
MPKPVEWRGDAIRLLDQTRLPLTESFIETTDYRVVADAIRSLAVRGAPLIGITAAYAIALAARNSRETTLAGFRSDINAAIECLRSTRPTAVNLFWSLRRMQHVLERDLDVIALCRALEAEAKAIHTEDEESCRRIGEAGSALVPPVATIITHCNTGALATGGEGTAQSVIVTAVGQGKRVRVFADETRPLLQGARLTAWELKSLGIDVTLMTDSMAAWVMKNEHVDLVVVGADRIAANGDAANKIGTYGLAVQAHYHGIPFYVVAPVSTIDPELASGDLIPIEERNPAEVTHAGGIRIAPENVRAIAPAFDVTPSALITGIITDEGVYRPPFDFKQIHRSRR